MSKLIKIYESITPDKVSKDDPRRDSIIYEMQKVKKAPTAKAAREFVDWWVWNSPQEMDAWIRKARKAMGVK
jgi:hypothetical protein